MISKSPNEEHAPGEQQPPRNNHQEKPKILACFQTTGQKTANVSTSAASRSQKKTQNRTQTAEGASAATTHAQTRGQWKTTWTRFTRMYILTTAKNVGRSLRRRKVVRGITYLFMRVGGRRRRSRENRGWSKANRWKDLKGCPSTRLTERVSIF